MKRSYLKLLIGLLGSFLLTSCDFVSFLLNKYDDNKSDPIVPIVPNDPKEGEEICEHVLLEHEAKKATIEGDGNIRYAHCGKCGKYYNEAGEEITEEETHTRLKFFDYADSLTPVMLMGKELEVTFSVSDYQVTKSEWPILKTAIQNSTTTVQDIKTYNNKLVSTINLAGKEYSTAQLISYAYNTAELYNVTNTIYEAYYTCYEYYNELRYVVAKSSYKNSYYFGYSNSQIQSIITEYESNSSSQSSTLDAQMNSLLNDYKTGKKTAYDAYSQYVATANDYAQLYGYSNYLELAYPNIYGRDYSSSDTSKLKNYIINYLQPLYSDLMASYRSLVQQLQTNSSSYSLIYDEYQRLNQNFFGNYFSELFDYSKYIGGTFQNSFKNLFESENYFFSNVPTNNITAFVSSFSNGTPFMFMSQKYQTVSTFIHEFGHYNAAFTYIGNSYDVLETQSQGDEMLFYSYLWQKNKISSDVAKLFLYSQILSMLDTVFVGYIVNELEKFAYSTEVFTDAQLFNKFVEIAASINLDYSSQKNYMYLVLLNYQCYYISYATSAIASLELFAKSLVNLDQAKQAYISIYTQDSKSEPFNLSLSNANLYNIFTEQAYTLISTISEVL